MNLNEARAHIGRVLRDGEQPLVFEEAVALPYDDPMMRMMTGDSPRPLFVAVTPARLIELRDHNDHLTSARWGDMAGLSVSQGKKRKWQYQWQHRTQRQSYSPVQVSETLATTLQDIQAGRIPLTALPPETTTYTVLDAPHDDSALGRVAAAQGLAEKRCICDACGQEVGLDKPFGPECYGCHRTLQAG